MKTLKAKATLFVVALMMAVMLIPSVKAQAASVPSAPTGLRLEYQGKTTDKRQITAISWNEDVVLPMCSDFYGTIYQDDTYGYSIKVTTLSGEVIKQGAITGSTSYLYRQNGRMVVTIDDSRCESAPFIVEVTEIAFDMNNTPLQSAPAVIKVIPRPTVKGGSLVNNNSSRVKINFKKVKGAKSYTIYLASNKTGKYKKVGTTKKTSYVINKNFKKYKYYYVYVQANGVKINGKKYNSTKPALKYSNYYSFEIYTKYR